MAKLNYRNWFINCRPLKDNEGNWQLELEKGEIVHTFTMAKSMTVGSIEVFAYDRIDEYVEDEIRT